MTCKNSFIKSVHETLRHHLAAVFSTCIIFFTQLIVFFLSIQNYASDQNWTTLDYSYRLERLAEITQPGFSYIVPIILVAILLAFDFFRYMHSKQQMDFYESLPLKRKDGFLIRTSSAFFVFLIPYTTCTILEIVLLFVFGIISPTLITNLIWNFICMVLIFTITWLTGALAMIMTGHPVVAFFVFCVFSAYAPLLLRYIYPSYAYEYFKTYVTDDTHLYLLTYLSPIGLAYKLINANYSDWTATNHTTDFIIIIVMIILIGLLVYKLFVKRPSEAAGRAMAFEKCNPVIRILLVIPFTLYLGLYLSQVTSIASKIWMIFGFLLGAILLNGIIESVFQFDIRGLWANKKQMACCFATCIGIALIFWTDLFKYDDYLPKLDEVDAIVFNTNDYYDHYYNEVNDGISGEYLDDALLLAERLVEQDLDVEDEKDWIYLEYHLSNGKIKKREYYIDHEENKDLFDKIYATKEYKDDLCPLYNNSWDNINQIEWRDSISKFTLYMSDKKMELLFETYIAEFTPLTYSQVRNELPLGEFIVHYTDSEYQDFTCYVYPGFTQTISLLEEIMQSNSYTKDYGSLSESVIRKYPLHSLEIYHENAPITISDADILDSIKDELILTEYYYKIYPNYDWELYYDAQLALVTKDGLRYTAVIIPRTVADTLDSTF